MNKWMCISSLMFLVACSEFGARDNLNDPNGVSYNPLVSSSSQGLSSSSLSSQGVSSEVSSSLQNISSSSEPAPLDSGEIVDERDGQTYKWVRIGTQVWLSQDLNYSGDNGQGERAYTMGWCLDVGGTDTTDHSNSAACDLKGRLYDWYTANSGICPPGWRIASKEDWSVLLQFVGGYNVAGTKLRTTTGWSQLPFPYFGTDDFYFHAQPKGYRLPNHTFYTNQDQGHWWTSSEISNNPSMAYTYYMIITSPDLVTKGMSKDYGHAVRCIANLN